MVTLSSELESINHTERFNVLRAGSAPGIEMHSAESDMKSIGG